MLAVGGGGGDGGERWGEVADYLGNKLNLTANFAVVSTLLYAI